MGGGRRGEGEGWCVSKQYGERTHACACTQARGTGQRERRGGRGEREGERVQVCARRRERIT